MNIPQNVPRPNENHIVFWWQLHTNVGLLLETGTNSWRLAGRLLGFMIIAWLFVWEKTVIQCWSNQSFVVCWKALKCKQDFCVSKKKIELFFVAYLVKVTGSWKILFLMFRFVKIDETHRWLIRMDNQCSTLQILQNVHGAKCLWQCF